MIPRIVKTGPASNKPPSPFVRGKTEEPLSITFHTSSFAGASPEEVEAIEALRQLSNLAEIRALDTEVGTLPHVEIGPYEDSDTYIPIRVTNQNGPMIDSGIPFPNQWGQIAAQLTGQVDALQPDTRAVREDLLIAQAHYQLGYDILITLSAHLLSHRDKTFVQQANPRTPTEAAQIVGLFLRTRDIYYEWQAGPKVSLAFDRGLFYLVLVRHRLPHMWRYFSACAHANAVRHDDILFLG